VLVNGEIIKELGTKVHPSSDIKLAAIAKRKREKLATLILNNRLAGFPISLKRIRGSSFTDY